MGIAVDYETEQATRKILAHWYGESIVSNWNITEQTVVATAELLGATDQCSSVFKIVPKPTNAFSGIGIMGKMAYDYAKDAVKRAVTDNSYYNA